MSFNVIDEEDVPIPPAQTRGGRTPIYPFREMKVGDIKRFTAEPDVVRLIQRAAATFARRHKVKLVTRKITGGVRVWRVK